MPPCPDSTIFYAGKNVETGYPLHSPEHVSLAMAYIQKHEYDSARHHIYKGYSKAFDETDSIHLMETEAQLAVAEENYKRAYELDEAVLSHLAKETDRVLTNSLANELIDIYNGNELSARHSLAGTRLFLYISIPFLLALIASGITITSIARKKKQLELENANNKLDAYQQTVTGVFDFGYSPLSMLNAFAYDGDEASEYRKVLNAFNNDRKQREYLTSQMENSLNILHNGIIDKLRKQIPSLNEDSVNLYVYLMFGMSYKTIVAFAPVKKNESLKSVYKRTFNLREAIKKSGAPDTTLFLSSIPLRSTNGKIMTN